MLRMFGKRLGAYFLDILIVLILTSLITGFVPKSEAYREAKKKESEYIDKVLNNMFDDDFDDEKLVSEAEEFRYTIDKESIPITLITVVVYLAYFGTFPYYNKGQTLGKRAVNINMNYTGGKYAHLMFILRTFVLYGLLFNLIRVVGVLTLDKSSYFTLTGIVNGLQLLFVLATIVVFFSRKDKKTLHDLVFKTEVI